MEARPTALVRNALEDGGLARGSTGQWRFQEKAAPTHRLQARQWQTEWRTGSPVTLAFSAPQTHFVTR